MKKILFLLIVFFAMTNVFAGVLTVSNNTALPGSPGQYSTITAAISAAANGDTILIQGSATNYIESPTVNKPLTIIGPGYNPQTSSGLKAYIQGTLTFGAGSSNSLLMGVICYNIQFNSAFAISNIRVARCQLGTVHCYYGSVSATNLILEDNIFEGGNNWIQIGNSPVIIRNSIFKTLSKINGPSASVAHIIRNNLFLCTGYAAIDLVQNAIIENNIFFGCAPDTANGNVTGCTMNNNYIFGSKIFPYGTNVGSGNITSQNAIYSTFITCGSTVDYTTNFRPINGSLVKNAGTDASDIGPTGGASPIYLYPAPYPLTGEPPVPQVQSLTMPVSSTPQGGNLNVTVKARKRN